MTIREAVVINLDRDTDRRAWMEGQLEKLDLPVRWFTAFTPETMPDNWASRFADEADDVLLARNKASFASHLEVIALASRLAEDDWLLVLEDDLTVNCITADLVAVADQATRLGADLVKLGSASKKPTWTAAQAGRFRIVRFLSTPRGAGAYLISARGARHVLDRAWQLCITTDNFLKAEASRGLRTLGVLPVPLPQDTMPGGKSSIDPEAKRVRTKKRYWYGDQPSPLLRS